MNKQVALASTAEDDSSAPLVAMPVEIHPSDLSFDWIGQNTRHAHIRLPEGVIADHLNSNTDLFRRIQANQTTSLRKFDTLLLIAYDETWAAEALVIEAGSTGVAIGKPRITELPRRREHLLNDGKFKIAWIGNGYAVLRVSDNFQMTNAFANVVLAEKALVGLYPTPLA